MDMLLCSGFQFTATFLLSVFDLLHPGESIDTDLEITQKRWKNHTDGKIKFDEDNNTIRGIEVSAMLEVFFAAGYFCDCPGTGEYRVLNWSHRIRRMAHYLFGIFDTTIHLLQDMIFRINKGKPLYQHRKAILEEVVRQKTEGEYPNWEKLREISVQSSEPTRMQAIELGKEDEKEKNRVWAAKEATSPASSNHAAGDKKEKSKRKSSFFGLFKKK